MSNKQIAVKMCLDDTLAVYQIYGQFVLLRPALLLAGGDLSKEFFEDRLIFHFKLLLTSRIENALLD